MSTRATKRSRVVKWTGAAVLFGSVAATAPAAVVNATSAKNNLIIGINEPNAGWCTQDSPGLDQVAAKNSVLETLTIVNDKGKMVPNTAKSVTRGADATKWTVVLRDGIKYSDGSAFDAANVVANMYAQAGLGPAVFGPQAQAPSLPAIAWTDLFGSSIADLTVAYGAAQKGDLKPVLAIKAKVDAAVVVKDTLTLEFTLATPRPNFPFLLWNYGRSALLSTASLKSKDCGLTAEGTVGTGPFKLSSKGAKETTADTVLAANPVYWRSTAKNPLPKAKQVTFRILGDSAAKVAAVRTNAVDIALFGAGEGTSLNSMKKMGKKVTLYSGPIEGSWTFHFNTSKVTATGKPSGSPFWSQNAREAFAYAFDSATYTKVMTKGNGKPSSALAPPVHPFYQPKQSKTFNLTKAKAAAAAYKAEAGIDMSFIMPRNTTSSSGESSQLICDMMGKAGITCAVGQPVSSSLVIAGAFGLTNHVSLFTVASGYYADFSLLFVTKTNLEMSGFRLSNPALADCFTNARAISTKAAFASCVKELQEKSYWHPAYLEGGFLAWNNTAQGVGATPLPGGGNRPLVNGSGFDFASVKKVGK